MLPVWPLGQFAVYVPPTHDTQSTAGTGAGAGAGTGAGGTQGPN